MPATCLEKQAILTDRFAICQSDQERYEAIIALGRTLKTMPNSLATETNLVSGCQSRTYLHSQLVEGNVHFTAKSDALISAGLAALLLFAYHGETPTTILTCPPDFLAALELTRHLTPSRSNGLFALFLRMKKDAMSLLSQAQ